MAKLPNYLRSYRKCSPLSQGQVAFLLGMQNGEKVCRHERFVCEPDLTAALAYEVILQKPTNELFGGLYQRVQKQVAERAKILTDKIDRGKHNRRTALRHQFLTSITSKLANQT